MGFYNLEGLEGGIDPNNTDLFFLFLWKAKKGLTPGYETIQYVYFDMF